jgi:ribonuclease J
MKDRKVMASDGIVIVIANLDANTNELLGKVNITTRGFVLVNDNSELLKQLEDISKKAITSKLKTPINYADVKNEIILSLTPYIYDKTGRKPIILPVIMNVKKETKQQV